jgi:Recombination endonuclease VII
MKGQKPPFVTCVIFLTQDIERGYRRIIEFRHDALPPEGTVMAWAIRYEHDTNLVSVIEGAFLAYLAGLQPSGFEADVILGPMTLPTQQDNRCAICSHESSAPGDLIIDHDHQTGRVRGLLCSNCNSGLGFFRDNSAALLQAVAYLKPPRVK